MKLTLGNPTDPLKIESTGGQDYLSMLFSANSKCFRYWMKSTVALGPNAVAHTVAVAQTTSYTPLFFGKSYTNYPWMSLMANATNRALSLEFGDGGVGLQGWFMQIYPEHVTLGNCSGYTDSATVLVYDMDAITG